ncbi:MAG: hypothetical protein ACREGB_00040, partial [Candidatus Saccharimonadales bacterium]
MTQAGAQVDYLKRILDVSDSMLAALISVTSQRLALWVDGKDQENQKFPRLQTLYTAVDIAIRRGIPSDLIINMLQTPVNGNEDTDVSLLYLITESPTQNLIHDDSLWYLEFLNRFK